VSNSCKNIFGVQWV